MHATNFDFSFPPVFFSNLKHFFVGKTSDLGTSGWLVTLHASIVTATALTRLNLQFMISILIVFFFKRRALKRLPMVAIITDTSINMATGTGTDMEGVSMAMDIGNMAMATSTNMESMSTAMDMEAMDTEATDMEAMDMESMATDIGSTGMATDTGNTGMATDIGSTSTGTAITENL